MINNKTSSRRLSITLFVLASLIMVSNTVYANGAPEPLWEDYLRYSYFEDRPIAAQEDVIQLHAPDHAEDAATVPIKIYAMVPQTEQSYIKEITLLIDNNPIPFAGRFKFTHHAGRADLTMRIRMNDFSYVRAIAEMSDGSLHMSKRFIKASGGCSGPIPIDMEQAMARLGKMKLQVADLVTESNKPLSTKLRISHPNFSGFQANQDNDGIMPEHYVKQMKISFAGELVLSAETHVSISADPSFGFYLAPHKDGELVAEITDSEGKVFTKKIAVKGSKKTSDS